MTALKRFNGWYDRLPEGPRFSVFLGLMLPVYIASWLGLPGICFGWMLALAFIRACGKRSVSSPTKESL